MTRPLLAFTCNSVLLWTMWLGVLVCAPTSNAQAVIAVTNAAGFSENFDSMGPSGTVTPPGWFVGTNNFFDSPVHGTNIVAGNGSASTSAHYSFGASGSSDRALGSLKSGSGAVLMTEVHLVNLSGKQIASFTLSYTGEQWRQGGSAAANDTLDMRFKPEFGSTIDMGAEFTFNTPYDNAAAASALDGNQPTNRVTGIGGTFAPPSPIPNGQAFFLRWENTGGPFVVGHGMGIDDFSITFTLVDPPPVVVTGPATELRAFAATFNGSVNPNGHATAVWFEWGTTTNYGNVTAPQVVAAGTNMTSFAQRIIGLGTNTYHYRAVCSNEVSQVAGTDVTFTLTTGPLAAGAATGGGEPFDKLQPSLELNYLISHAGIFPSSDASVPPPFIGEVRLFAGNFAPKGWLLCHGQLMSLSGNVTLFQILGTTYGGDGNTNFALPDFRGRTITGPDQGPGLSHVDPGGVGGAAQLTLALEQLPVHTHSLPQPYTGNTGPAGSIVPRLNRQPYLGLHTLIYHQGNNPSGGQTTFMPFLAQMPMFAGASPAPENPARANGQFLAIDEFNALYSVIGTNFGGNGQTVFAFPDFRGRTPMGIGQGPGLTARALGDKPGVEHLLMTADQMPAHHHALPSVPPVARLTGSAGSNQPQTLLQPSLAVRFLISTNGEMPSVLVQATNKMIGEIQMYAGTNVPGGWALCDGQLLDVAAYPALFSVISNFYGGDGVTTFALPDLRGRVPVGAPTGQPGAAYGAEQFVLTETQMPAHTHPVPTLDFQTWCDLLGLVGPAAAFDADPDGDGAPNGLEWASGTELTNAMSFELLSIAAINQQAQLRFSRNTNATDVSIHLQRTANIADSNAWSSLVTNVAGAWSLPGIVTETDTSNPKAVEVSDPLTNHPAAVYRLKITRP